MRLKTVMDKLKKTVAPTEADKKRDKWRSKLDNARIAYDSTLSEVKKLQGIYEGTREVNGNPNKGTPAKDLAINIRNIAYELIESQVDSSIPMPKVTAIHEGDEDLARMIEKSLVNKVKILKLSILNDIMERIVPVQGGDFFLVEWDNTKGFHSNYGDVNVSLGSFTYPSGREFFVGGAIGSAEYSSIFNVFNFGNVNVNGFCNANFTDRFIE